MPLDQQTRVADDLGLLVEGRPGDDHLRLGQEQRIGAIGAGRERDRLVARGSFDLGQAPAGPHQHDGGDDRKTQDPERQPQGRKLVMVELREGQHISIDDRDVVRDGGMRRPRREAGPGRDCRANPDARGCQAPAGAPEPFRHSRCPNRVFQPERFPGPPAARRLRRGTARESSDFTPKRVRAVNPQTVNER